MLRFEDDARDLHPRLQAEAESAPFGVIGIDAEARVRVYNAMESELTGFTTEQAMGHHLFEKVAPCMNNALVAQRFRDNERLDVALDYVFTLRAGPRKVRLRLLSDPRHELRYVLVRDR